MWIPSFKKFRVGKPVPRHGRVGAAGCGALARTHQETLQPEQRSSFLEVQEQEQTEQRVASESSGRTRTPPPPPPRSVTVPDSAAASPACPASPSESVCAAGCTGTIFEPPRPEEEEEEEEDAPPPPPPPAAGLSR